MIQEALYKVTHGQNLSYDLAKDTMNKIMSGDVAEVPMAGFLCALAAKGPTVDEVTAFAEVMREKAGSVPHEQTVVEIVGTGGDEANTFNISTTSGFIISAAGIPVAKHGNRSISSKSGSADILEVLGITLTVSPEKIDYLLKEAGIAFLFAPTLHPAMGAVMHIRKELATPTIFNLLGPLINPYPLDYQLMGTYAGDSLVETAKTLGQLGRERAIVIHGHGGMDEANLAGTTHCAVYQNGAVQEFSFDPEEAGFKRVPLAGIVGGSAEKNKDILLSVLRGIPSAHYETVLLNAGLGFMASGRVKTLTDGIAEAEQSILSGAAYDRLQQLIVKQQEAA